MINWDKLGNKKKYVLPILGVILAVIFYIFLNIIGKNIQNDIYANQVIKQAQRQDNTIFAVSKIHISSSANAIDRSKAQNMKELSLYQYTDIAIYIDNFKEENGLTKVNTIKELYIDNINLNVSNPNIGVSSLSYANLLTLGNREIVTDFSPHDRIDFDIVYTNEENEKADYTKPTFYTDCSNPITLRYINRLTKKYSIKDDEEVSFDGALLKAAGVSTDDINYKIRFTINLVNNEDKYFSCPINLSIPLNDIYQGTSIKTATPKGQEYEFF